MSFFICRNIFYNSSIKNYFFNNIIGIHLIQPKRVIAILKDICLSTFIVI